MTVESDIKVKIGIVGPCHAGKTVLANFLADATEAVIEEYHPTHVVRVLEFDTAISTNNRSSKAEVELWDCSGDSKFQNTWPAIVWELHGIIFVFNPEDETQSKDLDHFYEHFVKKANINDTHCLVLAFNQGDSSGRYGNVKLSKNFSRIPQLEVNIREEGNRFRTDFQRFVGSLASSQSERREQVEMNIMRG